MSKYIPGDRSHARAFRALIQLRTFVHPKQLSTYSSIELQQRITQLLMDQTHSK